MLEGISKERIIEVYDLQRGIDMQLHLSKLAPEGDVVINEFCNQIPKL